MQKHAYNPSHLLGRLEQKTEIRHNLIYHISSEKFKLDVEHRTNQAIFQKI